MSLEPSDWIRSIKTSMWVVLRSAPLIFSFDRHTRIRFSQSAIDSGGRIDGSRPKRCSRWPLRSWSGSLSKIV